VTTSLSFSNTRRYVRVTGPLRQKASEPVSNVRRSCWEAGRACAHAHERASYDFLNFRHARSPTISRCTLIVSVSGSAAMSKVISMKRLRGDISQGARRDVSIARIVKILPPLIKITATRISATTQRRSSRILSSVGLRSKGDRAFSDVDACIVTYLLFPIIIIDALTRAFAYTWAWYLDICIILFHIHLLSFTPRVSNLGCIKATVTISHPKLRKMHRYLLFDLVRKHVPFACSPSDISQLSGQRYRRLLLINRPLSTCISLLQELSRVIRHFRAISLRQAR